MKRLLRARAHTHMHTHTHTHTHTHAHLEGAVGDAARVHGVDHVPHRQRRPQHAPRAAAGEEDGGGARRAAGESERKTSQSDQEQNKMKYKKVMNKRIKTNQPVRPGTE